MYLKAGRLVNFVSYTGIIKGVQGNRFICCNSVYTRGYCWSKDEIPDDNFKIPDDNFTM